MNQILLKNLMVGTHFTFERTNSILGLDAQVLENVGETEIELARIAASENDENRQFRAPKVFSIERTVPKSIKCLRRLMILYLFFVSVIGCKMHSVFVC